MLMDINDFVLCGQIKRWIKRDRPQVFAYRDLDALYQAVGKHLDIPENADLARTLAAMGYEPRQTESGFWVLEFEE